MVYTLIYKTFFNNKYSIWFSSMLKDLFYKKKIAHILFKQTTFQINYNKFSLLGAKCKFHPNSTIIIIFLTFKILLKQILNYFRNSLTLKHRVHPNIFNVHVHVKL